MSEEKLKGGLADGKPDSKYDSSQLRSGVKVEFEHTTDPDKAKEVAKDHLEEIPDYYTRLEKMEEEALGKQEKASSYADYLAKKCVQVKHAADVISGSDVLADMKNKRQEFERSIQEEEVQRNYAARMNQIAEARARGNTATVGDLASTALGRISPVPHSLGEAATRLPLIALGTGLGYRWGAERSSADPESIIKILTEPNKEKRQQFLRYLSQQAVDSGSKKQTLDLLRKTNPEVTAKVLRDMPFTRATPEMDKLRGAVTKTFGQDGLKKLRDVIKVTSEAAGKPTVAEGLLRRIFKNRYTALPALIGGGAAAVGSGLAYALPDMLAQRKGGRGAVAAREEAQKAEQRSRELAELREQLLRKLEAGRQ